jgi:uncharacterized membrane protein YoaK (UPF0700 family)
MSLFDSLIKLVVEKPVISGIAAFVIGAILAGLLSLEWLTFLLVACAFVLALIEISRRR